MLSEVSISKYEAFLTDLPLENWNQNLPMAGIINQLVVSIFLITTAVNIKIFFKCKRKVSGKPKIKTIISFKWINIVYSFGLVLEVLIRGILLHYNSKDSFILFYDTTFAFNLMLTIFLVSSEDAKKFVTNKFRSWKAEHLDNNSYITVFQTKRNKISPSV